MPTLEYLVKNIADANVGEHPEVTVSGIAYDSRRVRQGDLFVCIRGYQFDGHDFAIDAVRNGAKALVVEEALPKIRVPQVKVADSREALGLISAEFWGHPSRRLRIIGVSGTNGKTTTTYLIKSLLEQAGYKVGLIGTINNWIGPQVIKSEHTTPESSDLQALFSQMVDEGVTHVVMEVSSHAVVLKRIVGTEFDIGVFTNITQDHLDFHGSFEHYLEAKTQFFAEIGVGALKSGPKAIVLNADDPASPKIAAKVGVPVISYGLNSDSTLRAENVRLSIKGIHYQVVEAEKRFGVDLNLLGQFNVYNSLAALGVGRVLGIDFQLLVTALGYAQGVRGRAELVDQGQEFAVVIDYAHTPDGLDNILRTARGFTAGKLLVVFGCGGDRDRTKRPQMGRIAGELADMVIVTSDNPRGEDPDQICENIVAGVQETASSDSYRVIVDRRSAIISALQTAKAGDVVVIAGKGHEDYQVFKDKIIHFDDRQEAAEALKAILEKDAP